jgi:hypothetical protein
VYKPSELRQQQQTTIDEERNKKNRERDEFESQKELEYQNYREQHPFFWGRDNAPADIPEEEIVRQENRLQNWDRQALEENRRRQNAEQFAIDENVARRFQGEEQQGQGRRRRRKQKWCTCTF